MMEVDIVRSSPQAKIYLQQFKHFPGKYPEALYVTRRIVNHKYDSHRKLIFADEACKPQLHDGVATFKLSLLEQDMLRCGITRVLNKVTVSCHEFFTPDYFKV